MYVCTSVACHLSQRQGRLRRDRGEAGEQGLEDVEVREFECLGACDMAPMASIDGRYVGPLTTRRRAASSCAPCREGREPFPGRGLGDALNDRDARPARAHRRARTSHRIGVYERLGGYAALRKALLEMTPEEVLHELEESGLRGRGGAGFSMGKKASFIPKGAMDKYLCCNADESEPGTFKDRLLMQKNPHLLIEGCVIGSIAAGANKGFIFIRGEYELQADILDAAVARGLRARLPRRAHPRLRALLRPGRAPRQGRLHLRRGDRRCSTRSRASAATRA